MAGDLREVSFPSIERIVTTRVVTDGAADLPEGLARSMGVTVVRGALRLGDHSWGDGSDMDLVRLWADIDHGGRLPATEAPSVQQLGAAYARDRPVIAVHVSAELSQVVAHARDAAASSGAPVHLVDSRSLSVGTGLVALAAAEAVQAGAGGEPLEAMVQRWVDQLHVHVVIDDVGFLVRGGRAGLLGAGPGSHSHRRLVAVKGHVIPIGQARHRPEALRMLVAHVAEHAGGGVSRWAVGHGNAPDIEDLTGRLASAFGCEPSYVTLLGGPTGCHLGPRSVVVGFFSDF